MPPWERDHHRPETAFQLGSGRATVDEQPWVMRLGPMGPHGPVVANQNHRPLSLIKI